VAYFLQINSIEQRFLKSLIVVRSEVLTAVRLTMFWVVAPCRLVGRYQCFGETYCLHL
jgi:hypothetical protein